MQGSHCLIFTAATGDRWSVSPFTNEELRELVSQLTWQATQYHPASTEPCRLTKCMICLTALADPLIIKTTCGVLWLVGVKEGTVV